MKKTPLFKAGATGLAALACATAGAFTGEEPLNLVFVVEAEKQPTPQTTSITLPASSLPTQASCAGIAARQVADRRPSRTTMGAIMFVFEGAPAVVPLYAASLMGSDAQGWLKSAVQTVKPAGITVGGEPSAQGPDFTLRLAHGWTTGLNLHSHVIVQVTVPGTAGPVTTSYHGFGTRLNWANGISEYMTTLNMAMTDAMVKASAGLNRDCESGRLRL